MRITIGSDHAGFELKQALVDYLRKNGHQVKDVGTNSAEPVDYPDFAEKVGLSLLGSECDRGILICGSGVGAAVCANKIPGVRAGLIHDHFSARQGVEDDHMNIICMGGRTVGPMVAWDFVQTFLSSEFSQAERHLRRLAKVASLEEVTK